MESYDYRRSEDYESYQHNSINAYASRPNVSWLILSVSHPVGAGSYSLTPNVVIPVKKQCSILHFTTVIVDSNFLFCALF